MHGNLLTKLDFRTTAKTSVQSEQFPEAWLGNVRQIVKRLRWGEASRDEVERRNNDADISVYHCYLASTRR